MGSAALEPPASATVDDALLREIVRKIVENFNPRRIILFGSRGRGHARLDSDVDLFIEMETSDPPFERRRRVRSLFPRRRWSLDLIVHTPQEVAQRRGSLISLVPVIEEEGKVLYERTES